MKAINKTTLTTVILLASIGTSQANLTTGAGVGVSTELYRDYYRDTVVLPLVSYDSERFYLRGLSGGYYLFKNRTDRLTLDVHYMPLKFNPSRTNNWAMKQLDYRRSTAMAGISYQHLKPWGIIKTSLSGDILNNNNGLLADATYRYPIQVDKTTIMPGIGVTWSSQRYNRYYFGINGGESIRSGLASYRPHDSWTPHLDININHQIDSNWSVYTGGKISRLPSTVRNSPMVDRHYHSTLFGGVNYRW